MTFILLYMCSHLRFNACAFSLSHTCNLPGQSSKMYFEISYRKSNEGAFHTFAQSRLDVFHWAMNPIGFQTQHSEVSWAFRVSLTLEPINLQVKTFRPLRNWPFCDAPNCVLYRKCPLFQKISRLVHRMCIDSWSKGVINTGAADIMMIAINIFTGWWIWA